ncbi:hypothetical protein LXT21_09175 [Myxococcus sp. K38C18041901]|uniref:hypothetical protein n=1 Tax=Myxococcus guangdongensis TaxID=2906760 RepID=UPI0020A805C6|nr:hypothetical protein [Myxococcus guangdongensis]MCP3058942.1 hypothetical protein [Myxococcus guangdongensis]
MLISLVAVLTVVAAQAPALPAPQGPLSVLVAPPDATGTPSHIVDFAREHVTAQLEARGVRVIRMDNVTRKMPATKRRALLRCKRTEAPCLQWLGTASQAEVVLITELVRKPQGYRAGVKTHAAKDGALISEHSVSDVLEDRLLDALTQTLDVVLPATLRALRPPPPAPRIDDVPPPTRVTRPGASEPGPETSTVPEAPAIVQKSSSARRWAWLPAAGGVVLAGVGTVFYLKAKDRYDTLETGGTDLPLRDSDALVSQGKNAQTVSRVAFGLGAAGLVAGAVMFLWPEDPPAKVVPSATVTSGGAMVGLSGTWP